MTSHYAKMVLNLLRFANQGRPGGVKLEESESTYGNASVETARRVNSLTAKMLIDHGHVFQVGGQ